MITKQIALNISGGVAPYEYTFYTSNTCATFLNTSGVLASNGLLSNTVFFSSESCLDDAVITLHITDAQGCATSATVAIDDPCDNFSTQPINRVSDLSFSIAAASFDCSSVSFDWAFNTNIFEVSSITTSNFNSILSLNIKEGARRLPASSSVSVVVTDCNGCSAQRNFSFAICTPILSSFVLPLTCIFSPSSDNLLFYASQQITLPTPSNCTTPIDWSTLELTFPSGIASSAINPSTPNTFSIVAQGTMEPGTYLGYWNVSNTQGLAANQQGTFVINIPDCDATSNIFIINTSVQIDCDATPNEDYVEVVLDDLIVTAPGTVIDWSTFQVLTSSNVWTATHDDGSFPIAGITYTFNAQGKRVLRIPLGIAAGDGELNDAIVWSICDTDGNCSDAGIISIIQCTPPPVAVNDEICSTCGQPVTFNPLSNDTSTHPMVLNSIEIEAQPTKGIVLVNSNGTITYTPNTPDIGEDSFAYSVKNVFGQKSNTGTVTVDLVCAGGDVFINLCN